MSAALPMGADGVARSLSGDVGGGPVNRLEDAGVTTLGVDVGAGGEVEAAGQRAAEVGEDVGVAVRGPRRRTGPPGGEDELRDMASALSAISVQEDGMTACPTAASTNGRINVRCASWTAMCA